jgi:hypothetical protein
VIAKIFEEMNDVSSNFVTKYFIELSKLPGKSQMTALMSVFGPLLHILYSANSS